MGWHRIDVPYMGNAGPQWSHRYRCEWGIVVGGRVKRLRESRNLLLREVALQVRRPDGNHYSSAFLSRLENGWASPPLWVYVALAQRFEVEPGTLLGPEEVARPWTDSELTLLRVLRRLGIDPDEAIVRLTAAP